MYIPESLYKHQVFDELPEENYPSPWSKRRIMEFQQKLDAIAGLAPNGMSHIRLIWPADSDESLSMHIVNGEKRARYRLYTQEYECIKQKGDIEIVEYLDVDITPPRFIIEEYHYPEEEAFATPPEGMAGKGYYTHLWSVAHHDEDCCGGSEARSGELCLGLYREPNYMDLDELKRRLALRDVETMYRRIGERATYDELLQSSKDVLTYEKHKKEKRTSAFEYAFNAGLKTHASRIFSEDPSVHKHGKFRFIFNDQKRSLIDDAGN